MAGSGLWAPGLRAPGSRAPDFRLQDSRFSLPAEDSDQFLQRLDRWNAAVLATGHLVVLQKRQAPGKVDQLVGLARRRQCDFEEPQVIPLRPSRRPLYDIGGN